MKVKQAKCECGNTMLSYSILTKEVKKALKEKCNICKSGLRERASPIDMFREEVKRYLSTDTRGQILDKGLIKELVNYRPKEKKMESKYYVPSIEVWKDVVNYEELYEVSNLGNVRRKAKNLATPTSMHGYQNVSLSKGGLVKTHLVHRIVARAFLTGEKDQVNHKDCSKTNNNVNNLEWVTVQENIDHAVENQLHRDQNGENNNMVKLTEDDVLLIRNMLGDGITAYSIHRDYYPSLHLQTIYAIKQRRIWNHI